jgi:antitoxin YefM
MRHKLIAISKAKSKLLEITRKVHDEGEAYVLTKDGEAMGALIPMENYESLLETSDVLADQETLKNLERALYDEKTNNLWKRDKGGKWIKSKKKTPAA